MALFFLRRFLPLDVRLVRHGEEAAISSRDPRALPTPLAREVRFLIGILALSLRPLAAVSPRPAEK